MRIRRAGPPTATLGDLRAVVDRLPLEVRIAMRDRIAAGDRIITGAYADGDGGVCPMLAAHRHGARVTALDFARTWDAFAGAPRAGGRAAPAAAVRALHDLLRTSIAAGITADELRRTPAPRPLLDPFGRPEVVRTNPRWRRGLAERPADRGAAPERSPV